MSKSCDKFTAAFIGCGWSGNFVSVPCFISIRIIYFFPTVHFILISTGPSAVAEATLESALFPDFVGAFLDFEQPANNKQPVAAQSVRMTASFFMGFIFFRQFIEPFINEMPWTIVLDSKIFSSFRLEHFHQSGSVRLRPRQGDCVTATKRASPNGTRWKQRDAAPNPYHETGRCGHAPSLSSCQKPKPPLRIATSFLSML
jgi:hypothetical protein